MNEFCLIVLTLWIQTLQSRQRIMPEHIDK